MAVNLPVHIKNIKFNLDFDHILFCKINWSMFGHKQYRNSLEK